MTTEDDFGRPEDRNAPSWRVEAPIETARLLLRPHRESDLDDLVRFHSDPDVVRYLPWPVRNREQVREALAIKLRSDRADQDGDWVVLAIERRDSGTVVGEVLLKRVDAAAGVAELGFALATAAQRQGIGYEAADAMLRLGSSWGVSRFLARADARNVPSAHLLHRLGFRDLGSDTADPPVAHFALSD